MENNKERNQFCRTKNSAKIRIRKQFIRNEMKYIRFSLISSISIYFTETDSFTNTTLKKYTSSIFYLNPLNLLRFFA